MAQVPRKPPIVDPPIRLAVCVSGEGTTLQNLIDQIRGRKLKAEIVQVVASRPRIGADRPCRCCAYPIGSCQSQRTIPDRVQHVRLRTDPP